MDWVFVIVGKIEMGKCKREKKRGRDRLKKRK